MANFLMVSRDKQPIALCIEHIVSITPNMGTGMEAISQKAVIRMTDLSEYIVDESFAVVINALVPPQTPPQQAN